MLSPIRTVLVTGVGGPAGASVIRQLRDRGDGLRIIATDIREVEVDADVFLLGPRADSPDLAVFLRSAIARYDIDLLIPTVQDELPAVSAIAPTLNARVVMSGATATATCHDKYFTALCLTTRGLAVPWTRIGSRPPLEYPLVLKPRVSRGGRGVMIIESPEDFPGSDASLITQGFAAGVEYCPQVYRSPLDGSVRTVVLEKTKLREGRVGNAESVLRLERADAPDVAELAEAAVVALDLLGPVDMDIRRDSRDRPLVLEINARFGANCAHAPEQLNQLLEDAARIPARQIATVR